MNSDGNWPSGWLKATLATCVLRIVQLSGGTYGHEVMVLLSERGLGQIGGGTLYPLLRRLAEDGLVTTTWVEGEFGPARKVYVVTDAGRRELAIQAKGWEEFTKITNELLTGKGMDNVER